MYSLAEQTVAIACPVDVAYRFTCNLERFGAWFPGVIAIESANRLTYMDVGKEYLETVAIPLRGTRKVGITVKEVELNQRFVTEGTLVPLLPRMEIHFRSTGSSSCEVRWQMLSRNTGWLARTLMVPLARRVMQKRATAGMAALKRTLESAGQSHDG